MATHRHDDAQDEHTDGPRLRLADLAQRRVHRILRQPDAPTLAALARSLDLLDLRKVRLDGTLTPVGRHDWDLTARLGATVVQPCVATLAPVTTRIEDRVDRRFRADLPDMDTATEIEMPEDDTLEQLPDVIDFDVILTEALALALPPYPRADDAQPVAAQFTPPGAPPLADADMRPFAGLASLRTRLAGDPATPTPDTVVPPDTADTPDTDRARQETGRNDTDGDDGSRA